MEEKNTVAIYIRVGREDNKRVKEQERQLKAYCKTKNYSIYDIYIDNGFSGKKLDRPSFSRMMGDFWDKKFNKVLVFELASLSRDITELSWRLNLFKNKDVELESLKDNICSSSAMGKAFISILSLISEVCGENAF
ncbi:MAG: recombinase family protein [Firmicutes bacterium]|nr:recombinase family protein [Bacillota bacterium]